MYLNEYARDSWFTRVARVAVNNLAGVPSIVYGVFGLGFLIYGLGDSIDSLFFGVGDGDMPIFGSPGLLWASVTMALLTVPVVVVATEEGLRAIPREQRDGALALGATRWEMLSRVILPGAKPGILTGAILAISRAAGEVAPLMLTGVVGFEPDLPISTEAPFLHLQERFMHLGFHIYAVGFQSPNVEAAEPLVYATASLVVSSGDQFEPGGHPLAHEGASFLARPMTETVVTDAHSEPSSRPTSDLGRIAADSASRRSLLEPSTEMVIRSEKLNFFYDNSGPSALRCRYRCAARTGCRVHWSVGLWQVHLPADFESNE